MKYYELNDYEKEILRDYEAGKFKPLPKAQLKKEAARMQVVASKALDKTKNINIRLSEADLFKIKSLAIRKGLPYQTLIASLVHQHATGQIKEH